jgi:hypothetical protein
MDIEIYLPGGRRFSLGAPRPIPRASEMGPRSVRLGPVRVLIVGESPETAAIGRALESEGVAVAHRGDGPPPAGGADEIAAIAHELREIESAMVNQGAGAVVVASHSPGALAAVIVATKLGTPVARLGPPDGGTDEGVNSRLIRRLVETTLAPDDSAVLEWVRASYAPER